AERVWAQEWLEVLLVLQAVRITPGQRKALSRALELLGESPSRTLTDLVNTVQDRELRDGLAHYTLAGGLGGLLDATRDSLGESPFQVFEIGHLMNLGEKTLVPVLLYLFHRVEQRLQDGRPSLLIVEEAWVTALNSVFGQKVEEWLRTLRKHNTAVVFVSQSLGDVAGAARRDLILESCPTKIFLPNPEAESEQVRRLYQGIGLNRRQTQLLAMATPKRQYYYASPLGRRLITLGLGPVALSFVGMAGREAILNVNELMATRGHGWPAEWLSTRGFSQAADTWRGFAPKEEKQ